MCFSLERHAGLLLGICGCHVSSFLICSDGERSHQTFQICSSKDSEFTEGQNVLDRYNGKCVCVCMHTCIQFFPFADGCLMIWIISAVVGRELIIREVT